jgi:hypothetical protein
MTITSLSIVVLISYSIQNIKCAQKPASRKYATGESRLRSGPLVSTSCAYCRQGEGRMWKGFWSKTYGSLCPPGIYCRQLLSKIAFLKASVLDSGRNSECVEQVRRTVLASENYEVATPPLKAASSSVMKRPAATPSSGPQRLFRPRSCAAV